MTNEQCPHCGKQSIHIDSMDTVPGDKVVIYDPNNGPVYWAECGYCGAHGPLVSFAADAIKVFTEPMSIHQINEEWEE